ncbi:MAG TPA: hypothetical protein P5511_08900 [Candidatus Goldiibacteriota bacterium]|nr:hypothetical protein [Candidatus Goldiibacteriota bacterium]
MTLGVIIGVILLLLLIGLVVLQAMIEWGNFDPDKLFAKKQTEKKPAESGRTAVKKAKPAKKPAKKAKGKK